MPLEPEHRLQVLIANEHDDRLETIRAIVEALGHEVVGSDLDISGVGPLSRSTGAEIALVGLGLDGEHALEQISAIVHEAACPVIALLDAKDPRYVNEAPSECLCVRDSGWKRRRVATPSTLRSGRRRIRTCKADSAAARSSNKPKHSLERTASTPNRVRSPRVKLKQTAKNRDVPRRSGKHTHFFPLNQQTTGNPTRPAPGRRQEAGPAAPVWECARAFRAT